MSLYGRCATVKDCIDDDSVNKPINYDDDFRVLRNKTGSPASWQKMQYN